MHVKRCKFWLLFFFTYCIKYKSVRSSLRAFESEETYTMTNVDLVILFTELKTSKLNNSKHKI